MRGLIAVCLASKYGEAHALFCSLSGELTRIISRSSSPLVSLMMVQTHDVGGLRPVYWIMFQ